MDFGGFILFILLTLGLLISGIYLATLFIRRLPVRRYVLGIWLGGMVILSIFGRGLYQVYWLDENLYIAANSGNTAQVKALLAAGASSNAQWEDGSTVMEAAEKGGHNEIIALLQKSGGHK